jgi:hypothetical protein
MNMKVLFRKNGPLLFTIGAGIGLVAAVVSAYKAGGDAAFNYQITKENIETIKFEAEEKKSRVEGTEDADLLEKDAETAIHEEKFGFCVGMLKGALLPLGLTAGSLFCLINAQKMNMKTIAAIGAGYAALSTKSDIIEKKVRQFIGEYKEDEFDEEVAQDWIDRSPVTSNGAVIESGHGEELFFDSFSGRYFLSDKDYVVKAIDLAKSDLKRGGKRHGMVLNDWYHNYLDIPTVDLGGYFHFPNDTFNVKLVRVPCPEKAVAPYCWALQYDDVDTI